MSEISRRRYATALGLCGIATLAGCGEAPSRTLVPLDREFFQTPSGEFAGEVSVKAQVGLAEKSEWEAFHDVQVRGFSADRELVCVADYGDIPLGETHRREVRCDRFPSIIMPTADESPCESATYIDYLVYVEDYDGTFVWSQESLSCNEDIPPEGEETPVTPTETPASTGTPTATTSTTTESARNRTDDTPSTSSDGLDWSSLLESHNS